MPLWGDDIDTPPLALVENQDNLVLELIDVETATGGTKPGANQGWVGSYTYTAHDGSTRVKREVLVALSDTVPPPPEEPLP